MGKKLFKILLVLIVISLGKGVNLKTEEKSQGDEFKNQRTNYRSCIELGKYNINSVKVELKNKGLKEIECISQYKELKEIDLRWNEIKDVKPLEKLHKLEILKINFNQIEDIKPILGLKKIKELWIHNNKIRDIRGIGNLINLKHLDLSFNPLEKGIEELSVLKNLKRLDLREVPKKVVDYIYSNYEKFMDLSEIYIEERNIISHKVKSSNKGTLDFSDFENKIKSFETIKTIEEINPIEISKKNIPRVVVEIISKYEKKSEEDDDKVESVDYYKDGKYSMYTLIYPFAYAGKSNSDTYFLKEGRIVASKISYIVGKLENINDDGLYLAVSPAPGAANYIIADLRNEKTWDDGHRDYEVSKKYRTGKVYKTNSSDEWINVRNGTSKESQILYRLRNNIQVEEIFQEGNWKYVYVYNEKNGYYMKGYIHNSQLK